MVLLWTIMLAVSVYNGVSIRHRLLVRRETPVIGAATIPL